MALASSAGFLLRPDFEQVDCTRSADVPIPSWTYDWQPVSHSVLNTDQDACPVAWRAFSLLGSLCLIKHHLITDTAIKNTNTLHHQRQKSNSKRSGTPFSQIQRFSKSCKGSPIPLPLWTLARRQALWFLSMRCKKLRPNFRTSSSRMRIWITLLVDSMLVIAFSCLAQVLPTDLNAPAATGVSFFNHT